jgi:hypothetical protein
VWRAQLSKAPWQQSKLLCHLNQQQQQQQVAVVMVLMGIRLQPQQHLQRRLQIQPQVLWQVQAW